MPDHTYLGYLQFYHKLLFSYFFFMLQRTITFKYFMFAHVLFIIWYIICKYHSGK